MRTIMQLAITLAMLTYSYSAWLDLNGSCWVTNGEMTCSERVNPK